MKIRRILVPVDFSRESLRALEYAVTLGGPFDARFTLLHVISAREFIAVAPIYGPVPRDLITEHRRQSAEKLAVLAQGLTKRGMRVRSTVKLGVPYDAIVEEAAASGADLIVMGSHGRSGLSRILMGSVADTVIRHARCPVLVVRRKVASRKKKTKR